MTFVAQIFGDAHHTSQAVDADGYTYIGGRLNGTVDFNPGPELDLATHTPFVAKYDPSGAFLWARAFEVNGKQKGVGSAFGMTTGIALDGDAVFITGVFSGTKDFDPDNMVSETRTMLATIGNSRPNDQRL